MIALESPAHAEITIRITLLKNILLEYPCICTKQKRRKLIRLFHLVRQHKTKSNQCCVATVGLVAPMREFACDAIVFALSSPCV